MDEMFRATAMVAALLICLGVLNHSSELYHEFFHYSLESIRVITIWALTIISIFFFQLCHTYSRFLKGGWLPLSFLRGKKLLVLGLDELLAVWNTEPHNRSMESSFSASQVALR